MRLISSIDSPYGSTANQPTGRWTPVKLRPAFNTMSMWANGQGFVGGDETRVKTGDPLGLVEAGNAGVDAGGRH